MRTFGLEDFERAQEMVSGSEEPSAYMRRKSLSDLMNQPLTSSADSAAGKTAETCYSANERPPTTDSGKALEEHQRVLRGVPGSA